MSELNYEAIGRCKVLNEKIKDLNCARNKYINELRVEVGRLAKGNINNVPPEVVVFDIALIESLAAKVGDADANLMQAISEFNNWCQDAGEKPVRLITPDRV